MDYRLLYTQKAVTDLGEIIGYITGDSPEAALRFGRSLLEHVELLTRFPRMGGIVKKRSGVRKLLHSPILVYYQVHKDQHVIEILHFRHGMRKPPASEFRLR